MKRYRILFLLLGFFLLAVLIYRTGPHLILSYIGMIGWRFILIIGAAFCWQLGNTIAWGLAFERKVAPPFGIQFFAKLGGDAINHITPLLNLGGEFVKPYLIRSHAPIPAGFSSIIITKTLQAVAGVIYALVGLSVAFFIFDLPVVAWVTMGLFLRRELPSSCGSLFNSRRTFSRRFGTGFPGSTFFQSPLKSGGSICTRWTRAL